MDGYLHFVNKYMHVLHRKSKKYVYVLAVTGILCILFSVVVIFLSDHTVHSAAKDKLYSNMEEVPSKKVGLLLGTSKYSFDGQINLFYTYRINAAIELFQADKIEFILVSGDNSTHSYNEPEQMQNDLVAAGIPATHIYLDYAGFRTWDSIIRAHKVFLENDFIVISQQFHNERAIYTATQNGIDAIGFNAQEVPISRSPRIWVRERFARVKAVWDGIVDTEPTFLGDTIEIN